MIRAIDSSGPREKSFSRLNDRSALCLFFVLALSPIPFGSNRPVFWAIWCLVLTTILITYLLAVARQNQLPRVPISTMRTEFVLFSVYGSVLGLQLLPLKLVFDVDCLTDYCGYLGQMSLAPGDTWFELLRWLTYGMLFFLTVQVAVRPRRSDRCTSLVVLTTTAIAAYGLLALSTFDDTILFIDKTSYRGFATGTFINRNSFATFLGIGLVVALSTAISSRHDELRGGHVSGQTKAMLVTSMMTLLTAILATQSRMGLFSTVIASCLVVALRFPPGRMARLSLLLGSFAVVLWSAVNGGGLLDRALYVAKAAGDRAELYRQVASMISERPLVGYGAGSFKSTFPQFHRPSLDVGLTWDYAHSTYLALWTGSGVVIGSIPLVLVAAIIFRIFRSTRLRWSQSASSTAAVGSTALVLLHSLVDFSLEIQAVAILYTFVLALGVAPTFVYRLPKSAVMV